MKIEILAENENPLLKRKEFQVKVYAEKATPSLSEIRKKLISSKDIEKGTIVMDSFKSRYGSREVFGSVKVYKTKEHALEIEPKHRLLKNGLIKPAEDKTKEQKPDEPKAKESKPKEEKPKEQKPEEQKGKESKPKEEKPKEQKPDEPKAKEAKPTEPKPKESKATDVKPKEKKEGTKEQKKTEEKSVEAPMGKSEKKEG
ncbi:MAG: hypothetical protein V3R86_00880 [Candidatus Hydrothermarchaeaceae archaeon]